MTIRTTFITATGVALALALGASSAQATEFVTNGSFEDVAQQPGKAALPTGDSFEFGDTYIYGQAVTGWTSTTEATAGSGAFNIHYGANPTTVSPDTRYSGENQYLWTLPATADPDGGAFIGLDGDVNARGTLSQVISGLTPGQSYTLSFVWAAAQVADRTGDTTEFLNVKFGDESFDTDTLNNPSQSATGWNTVTHTFTATDASQVLSFLSIGTPTGLPPMALLDGVSLTGSVPEPATWAMMILGMGLVGSELRRRNKARLAAA